MSVITLTKVDSTMEFSNNNLTVKSITSSYANAICNVSKNSGKWYWEVTIDSNAPEYGGIGIITNSVTGICIGYGATEYAYYMRGAKCNKGVPTESYGPKLNKGNVLGVYMDLDNLTIGFRVNGRDYGKAYDIKSGSYYPAVSIYTYGYSMTFNFGASEFKYPIPEGYKPYNLSIYYLIEANSKFYTITKNIDNELILESLSDISLSSLNIETFETKGFKSVEYLNDINIERLLDNYKLYKLKGD